MEATPEHRKMAERSLIEHVTNIGAEQQKRVVDEVARTVIRDKLVDPRCMVFKACEDSPHLSLTYVPDNGTIETVKINNHALGQLADKSKPKKSDPEIFRKQMWNLLQGEYWHRELLAVMLNTFYSFGKFVDRRKNPGKFLNRLVDDELRGFLSRSFNRSLNTATSLRVFLESCAQHGAGPLEASTTSVRTRLKCVLPQVFEPVPGEFVAFGVTFGNSDFGSGTLSICNFILRVNSVDVVRGRRGHISVLDSAYSRTHLGSVIKDSDVELSDVTASKEVEAVNSAIKDVVDAQLNLDSIERTLDAIRYAQQEQIPWNTVQELLASVLTKQDIETAHSMLTMGVQDLPPTAQTASGEQVATNWWAANLVGWFAEKEEDADKKATLQDLAGSLITKADKKAA